MCRGYFEVFVVNFWASYLLLPYWYLGWASSRIGRMPHSPEYEGGRVRALVSPPIARRSSPTRPGRCLRRNPHSRRKNQHGLIAVRASTNRAWGDDQVRQFRALGHRPPRPRFCARRRRRARSSHRIRRFVHDRRLMREAQVEHLDPLVHRVWPARESPDHSSLARIRQRWGERFREIFRRTVRACLDAKVGRSEVVHVDCLFGSRGRHLGEPGRGSRG